MGEERRRYRNYRPRAQAAKPAFPDMPFPAGLSVSPKQIGFLHYHHGQSPGEIAGRYEGLNVALVHLGLYHYLQNEKAIKSELSDEATFNRNDSLRDLSMTLPSVGLGAIVDSMKFDSPEVESPKKRP